MERPAGMENPELMTGNAEIEAKKLYPNGMGIGIYFAKRVIRDHGGNVGAFSEGVGKGSTFWMELPMKKQA